jgi:hypothetical protein
LFGKEINVTIVDAGEFKKGDTLAFTVSLIDDNTQLPITGIANNLKCQGRYANNAIALEMTITETEVLGQYLLECLDTKNVKSDCDIFFDIQYTITPNDPIPRVISTDTFKLAVIEDETK